jgi:hypothetical protein
MPSTDELIWLLLLLAVLYVAILVVRNLR